jgi:hypothetical protein
MLVIKMACVTTNAKILIRRDTASNWTNKNPVLLDGEQGYEKDTGKMKIGDGVKTWRQLTYFSDIPTVLFDGGNPTTTYINGPAFDLGGVN